MALSDKRVLSITRNASLDVALVVCDLHDLDGVCAELVANWIKHSPRSESQLIASYRSYREVDEDGNGFGVFEFADNFDGSLNPDSVGGLGSARSLCAEFGGKFSIQSRGPDGLKSVKLAFREVSQRYRRGEAAS